MEWWWWRRRRWWCRLFGQPWWSPWPTDRPSYRNSWTYPNIVSPLHDFRGQLAVLVFGELCLILRLLQLNLRLLQLNIKLRHQRFKLLNFLVFRPLERFFSILNAYFSPQSFIHAKSKVQCLSFASTLLCVALEGKPEASHIFKFYFKHKFLHSLNNIHVNS